MKRKLFLWSVAGCLVGLFYAQTMGCIDLRYVPQCLSATDCPTGYNCVSGACTKTPGPGPQCQSTGDCPPAFICVSGKCTKESQPQCGPGAECPPAYICVSGKCVSPDPPRDAGTPDAQQPDRQIPEPTQTPDGGQPDTQKPQCTSIGDCPPEYICVSGKCTKEPQPQCGPGAECPPAYICVSGKCVVPSTCSIRDCRFSPNSAEVGEQLVLQVQSPTTMPFSQDAKIVFDGKELPTTRVSDTLLRTTNAVDFSGIAIGTHSLSVSCSGGVDSQPAPFEVKAKAPRCNAKDEFYPSTFKKIDVLLVIDDSGSMADEQQALANYAQSLFSMMRVQGLDGQIGVITSSFPTQGQTSPPGGCLRGNPRIISVNDSTHLGPFLQNVQVGTSGTSAEKGLEAAYQALSPTLLNDPNCNKGFLRSDAALSIIFVSDENDQSLRKIQEYLTFFQGLKSNPNLVKISAIVGPPPLGCTGATNGSRYWDLAGLTNGLQKSICTFDQNTLAQIFFKSFDYPIPLKLKNVPDPSSIQIKFKIKDLPPTEWTYDPQKNSILLGGRNVRPDESPLVEVFYTTKTCPPNP